MCCTFKRHGTSSESRDPRHVIALPRVAVIRRSGEDDFELRIASTRLDSDGVRELLSIHKDATLTH